MEKHTPGPWIAKIESKEFCDTGDYTTEATIEKGKSCVAQCFDHKDISEDEMEANTYLMAAAPEMYEAIYKLTMFTRNILEDINNPNYEDAKVLYSLGIKAIEKAEGKV